MTKRDSVCSDPACDPIQQPAESATTSSSSVNSNFGTSAHLTVVTANTTGEIEGDNIAINPMVQATGPNPAVISTNDLGHKLSSTIRVGWWNIQGNLALLHDSQFWNHLTTFDIVFLTETHHEFLPSCSGWEVCGLERTNGCAAGGTLAFITRSSQLNISAKDYKKDGNVWLCLSSDHEKDMWIAGTYVPGPSDPRFREAQCTQCHDYFHILRTRILSRNDDEWLLGGDFNCITNSLQSDFCADNPLDFKCPYPVSASRTSLDTRPVSAHGRRLLDTISNNAVILNGLDEMQFSSDFTRLPTKASDCPGVLDYIIAPPKVIPRLIKGSLCIIATPIDMSDHRLLAIDFKIGCSHQYDIHQPQQFRQGTMCILSVPETEESWAELAE